MKVYINATAFRASDDTESVKESEGAVKFLTDHEIKFTRYTKPETTMSGVHFPAENRVQWHENESTVEIDCSSVEDLRKICGTYDATFTVANNYVLINFE